MIFDLCTNLTVGHGVSQLAPLGTARQNHCEVRRLPKFMLNNRTTEEHLLGQRENEGAHRPNMGLEPDHLDLGPLGERLGYILRRAQVAVFHDFYATFTEVDIRPVQYSILTVIESNPGLSQTRVSETLGIKKTNFVAMLDVLEQRGIVRRGPTPGDRRTYALFLTDDGIAFMHKLHTLAAQHEQRIIDQIGTGTRASLFDELKALAALGKAKAGSK
jgi:DNA-binding MarR family transcriptional regulator